MKNDLMDGNGIIYYNDGSKCESEWKNGIKI